MTQAEPAVEDLLENADDLTADDHLVSDTDKEAPDDPDADLYPTPLECAGTDGVFVGRIRADLADPRAVLFWSVADNLRKGAALNAIQIGEFLIRESLD